MSKRLAIILVAGAALLVVAVPPAAGKRGFKTYPTCLAFSSNGKPPKDATCAEGDAFGAVLLSDHHRPKHYRLCWKRPDGKHGCARKSVRAQWWSTVVLGGDGIGTWKLTWKHGGHVLDRDALHVASEGV
jgi:hypothetical protein